MTRTLEELLEEAQQNYTDSVDAGKGVTVAIYHAATLNIEALIALKGSGCGSNGDGGK